MEKTLTKNKIAVIVTIFFSCISLTGILFHEVWMDEAHHWLLARDSNNLHELLQNTRYEGHPILWNLILFVITRFTHDALWMQLFHWIISVIVVFICMRFSPLPLLWNILFVFGYFTLYEYTVISRNYSLLVLTFFASIHFYTKRQYLVWGIVLFMLANTHLFGLILATWFVMSSMLDSKKESLLENADFKIAILIFISGAILSAIQIFPPADSPFRPQTSALLSMISVEKLLAINVRGFVPIPDFTNYHVWNSNLLTAVSKSFAGISSVILGFGLFSIMAQKKKILILFTGVFASIGLIMILVHPASIVQATRHYGVVYITFMGCLWLAAYDSSQQSPIKIFPTVSKGIITGLLLIQAIAGICMLAFDIKRPFSEAKNVVTFLEKENLQSGIVASMDSQMPSISTYLKKRIFSLSSGQLESYHKWSEPIIVNRFDSLVLVAAKTLINQPNGNYTLVTYSKISTDIPGVVLMGSFTKGIVETENFYVYTITVADND